ncbi:hypothetical protein [Rhizobium paknamense]|uniref:SnoaL-like domain-containing protein n=1 Tax=Rhizobium paknamense TaxID=1206817 RepID=A0ABU0IGB8_9HYPH|nr:hypothetical protein [Rhizobium paknamense]MDQ0456455.1 hypothetical protein [Rhizobium paknamense]
MRDPFHNPFSPDDPARHAIWEMLVPRDIDAFLAADWTVVAGDFIEDGFYGISGNHQADPGQWTLAFPTLAAYRAEWLRQAEDFAAKRYAEDPRIAIFNTTTLEEIDVKGDAALARKRFKGGIRRADGAFDSMEWQTLYSCRLHQGRWKLSGFTGYLPYSMGSIST